MMKGAWFGLVQMLFEFESCVSSFTNLSLESLGINTIKGVRCVPATGQYLRAIDFNDNLIGAGFLYCKWVDAANARILCRPSYDLPSALASVDNHASLEINGLLAVEVDRPSAVVAGIVLSEYGAETEQYRQKDSSSEVHLVSVLRHRKDERQDTRGTGCVRLTRLYKKWLSVFSETIFGVSQPYREMRLSHTAQSERSILFFGRHDFLQMGFYTA